MVFWNQVEYKTQSLLLNQFTFTMFDPHMWRSHLFFVGAPGAAVPFTEDQDAQDSSQDWPYMAIQPTSG